jgi:hypothetical protein
MTQTTADSGRTDSPDRIFATVNGMSTRLPDGGRQFIGGWSEDRERPRAIEYIRADLVAELSAALGEIESALRKDSREKTITGDTVEYHLDGQTMYRAINRARAALSAKDGR